MTVMTLAQLEQIAPEAAAEMRVMLNAKAAEARAALEPKADAWAREHWEAAHPFAWQRDAAAPRTAFTEFLFVRAAFSARPALAAVLAAWERAIVGRTPVVLGVSPWETARRCQRTAADVAEVPADADGATSLKLRAIAGRTEARWQLRELHVLLVDRALLGEAGPA